MGLPRSVIRVLPQNNHFDLRKGGPIKGLKDVVHLGVDLLVAIFIHQEIMQLLVVGRFKLWF